MKLRTVHATRYVTPLREGGSLPGIVEADDAGMYVLKFRGAGQGPKVLTAERVPNSKKLVKLTVDLGTEHRTLVAGIAEAYGPKRWSAGMSPWSRTSSPPN